MHAFDDNKDRRWELDINCSTLADVRQRAGVDLAQLTVDQKVAATLQDPVQLCACLWVLVRDQAAGLNVDQVEFGRGLAGDALSRATEALLAEIIDFFPSETRPTVLKMIALGRQLGKRLRDQAMERMDDPRWIDRLLTSGDSSTSSPALSASSPAG